MHRSRPFHQDAFGKGTSRTTAAQLNVSGPHTSKTRPPSRLCLVCERRLKPNALFISWNSANKMPSKMGVGEMNWNQETQNGKMAKNQIDSRARNKVQMITSNARTVIRIAGRVGVVGAPGSRAGSGRRRGRFLRVGWALAFQYFFLLGLSAFARILFFEFL